MSDRTKYMKGKSLDAWEPRSKDEKGESLKVKRKEAASRKEMPMFESGGKVGENTREEKAYRSGLKDYEDFSADPASKTNEDITKDTGRDRMKGARIRYHGEYRWHNKGNSKDGSEWSGLPDDGPKSSNNDFDEEQRARGRGLDYARKHGQPAYEDGGKVQRRSDRAKEEGLDREIIVQAKPLPEPKPKPKNYRKGGKVSC